ncbi:Flp pilus assembly protein CpaB [Maricaulis sp. D1M11]|uniref:Flp pilus assembly protein CpaB n=1 Tax=Maricaulis sp. D1M11 TaxID=3076117 RepID=UPI0039B60180
MNAVRIAILVAAGVAAIVVAFLVRQTMSSEPVVEAVVEERPAVRILVARNDLPIGERVSAGDLFWQTWPDEGVSPGYIVEGRGQELSDYVGAVVRNEIGQGEPITGRRLVQQGEAGFMSAVLSPGMRAVAVPISAETGAGGFILPNDRVDVIVSFQAEEETGRSSRRFFSAETLVENARVLAIDQSFQGDDEDESVIGETATLELTPDQARAVSLAVARGEVTLILRSMTDASGGPVLVQNDDAGASSSFDNNRSSSVTLIRYGHAQQVAMSGDN